MADQSLSPFPTNSKDGEGLFNELYNKLNVLALFIDTKGVMDESSLSLDWSERRGITAMIRDMTGNLDNLWSHLSELHGVADAIGDQTRQ